MVPEIKNMKQTALNNSSENKPERMWPYGIIVAYIIFVGATLSFVFFTFTVNFDLVVPEYYSETLVYQDQIDRESNSLGLSEQISWEIEENQLMIRIPEELKRSEVTGTVTMYRASDASMDQTYDVALNDDGIHSISLETLAKGKWELQVKVASEGKEYYSEFPIFLR
ncbi:MAG TPA: hypothetical protein DCE78_00440 [Bacteroidetes bacterium]|nr:hypothetical protein [Bacteroidota bacterium]